MAIELIFPPKAMQQGFPALLEQMNSSGLYVYKSEGRETRLEWAKMVGWGSVSFTCFRTGLQISVEDYQMKEDLVMQGQHSYADPLKFYFLLSGELNGVVGSPACSFQLKPGQNCLTACGGDRAASPEENRAQVIYQRDQAYLAVAVLVDPWFLKTFPESKSALPQSLAETCFHIGSTSSAMQLALHQLLSCPYEGLLRQIYIESKALELITLKLAQINESINPQQPDITLQPRDLALIYQAKDILLSNLESPPSLLELAKQSGINDYKLKIGFRQVFGTTVFGYLRNQRMEWARQLLLEKQMNVSEVAQTVGYTSFSRFSEAFKKYFGIPPKAYQKNFDVSQLYSPCRNHN